jgi:hypothetical protein
MPSPPKPSAQPDGTPESLHKTQKPEKNERAEDRPSRSQTEDGDEHLGAEEHQVSDTSAPAGPAYKDEPKQG